MDTQQQDSEIVKQLESVNSQISDQNSYSTIFVNGIIHGIGFFIGSAIIATLALGILGPWFAEYDWIRENFERGTSLVK